MFKRIKLNYRNQLLRDGQNILSPQQKEEIIRTGKIILPI